MWVISILNRTAVFKNSQFKIQTFQNLCLTGGSAFAFTSIDFTPSNTRFNVCPTSKNDQTFSACRAITQLPVTPGEEKDYLSIDQLAHKLTCSMSSFTSINAHFWFVYLRKPPSPCTEGQIGSDFDD